MRVVGFQTIPIDHIDVGVRLRRVDPDHAQGIAASMKQIGLMHPIEVTYAGDGIGSAQHYQLLAGAHRLEAAHRIGWTEIPARLVEFESGDPDGLKLYHESIENIARHELNVLDRAVVLAEAKAVYEQLHPETKMGARGGRGGRKQKNEMISFSKDAARKMGITPRSIEQSVKLYNDLAPVVRAGLAGTATAGDRSELVRLAALEPERQIQVMKMLLNDGNDITRVKAAVETLDGPVRAEKDPDDEALKRLIRLYEGASKKVQKGFETYIADRNATAQKNGGGCKAESLNQIDLEDYLQGTGA